MIRYVAWMVIALLCGIVAAAVPIGSVETPDLSAEARLRQMFPLLIIGELHSLGMSITAKTDGADARVLRIHNLEVGRAITNAVVGGQSFRIRAKKLGFETIIVTDGPEVRTYSADAD